VEANETADVRITSAISNEDLAGREDKMRDTR
jgi:hypothetical protein